MTSSSAASQLKPIETQYKGYRFRSRLEARYAVFFDALGIDWVYEPEGFDLGDGDYYLPDFLIRNEIDRLWIEIKGEKPTEDEVLKATKLHQQSGDSVLIAWDTLEPRHLSEMIRSFKSMGFFSVEGIFYSSSQTGFTILFGYARYSAVYNACEKARSARFEKKRKRREKR